jgi:multiple sugar transport system permease protein
MFVRERAKHWAARGIQFGVIASLTAFAAFPFAWMLITTFKETTDLYNPNLNPFLFNQPPTLEHLHRLFYDTLFGQWLWNTAMVGVIVVAITLLLAVPAGYALARFTGRW